MIAPKGATTEAKDQKTAELAKQAVIASKDVTEGEVKEAAGKGPRESGGNTWLH